MVSICVQSSLSSNNESTYKQSVNKVLDSLAELSHHIETSHKKGKLDHLLQGSNEYFSRKNDEVGFSVTHYIILITFIDL